MAGAIGGAIGQHALKDLDKVGNVANKALDWIGLGDIAQCRNEGLAKFNKLLRSDPELAAKCAVSCANKNRLLSKLALFEKI